MFTTDTAHKALLTYRLHRRRQTADIWRQWGSGVCHPLTLLPPLPGGDNDGKGATTGGSGGPDPQLSGGPQEEWKKLPVIIAVISVL